MDSHISHNQTITSVIYILDDSKTELLIAEQIIVSKKIGKVSCFDNSKLFYKAIETQLPDIILIEMNMADTNSIDICLHLKSQPIIQFIPIILISASNDVETVKKCFSSGASDYISKPFIEDEMIARIRMHLSLKKIEDEMKIKNNSSETSLNEITSIEYINEYKRPYKTLQEKLRSYRKLFESSHDGYVVVDINGRFIEANNAYCKMLGYKINELMEKENFYAITPERWRKWEYDEIWKNRLLEIGVSGIYEKEYIRKDGTIFPVEIQAFTIFDDNRNIKYIYGFVRDITKHKLKENFLKESKQQLLDIINFLPDAIFAIDTSGKVIAWNFAIEKMTQVKAEDILGKGDYEYSLPFYGVRRPILIDLVSLNSQEIEDKYHFVRKEGDRLLAEISVMVGGQRRELWGIAKPLYNSEGKIVGAIESIRDITEFKLTENALKESEKFLRTVTDKVPEAIYVFNISKDGKMSFDFISGYAQELFGYSPQELKNNFSLALNLVIPEDAQGLQDSILTASSNKHDWNYDFRIYTQNGKKKWIRGMSALHEVSKDATIVFIGSLSDITEKKQAEEKIIEANKKLLAATQQSKALNQELITSNKNLLNKNIELKMKNFAIDTSINAIAFIDVNGKIFYVNNSLVKMWGYDNKEEIIGMIPSDLHPPGVFENEKNMFDIIAERGGLSDEIKARRKNGDLFDIHYTCSIVKDYDDNILCTMSVIEDITNRRKSENEILEKTTLLNAQLEISIDGILMVDSNEKVINYNSRFGELWQIPQHILDTKNDNTILEYVLKQLKNPQEFIDKVKYLYENKKEKSRDEIEFANGGYLDRYSAPITKPNGEYFGRIWFFRDITDKKKIEILLKESEQKFRTIFNSSSIGIAITKIDGTLLETNESFIKIFNFPNKEKILKSNASYFYANKEEREEIVKLFNKNKPLTDYEVKLKKFDGSLFYASMNWIPIIINDEEFYLSIVSDISERKNFQINLQNAYNKLKEFEYIINRSDIIVVLCRIDDFFSVKYVSDNVKNLGYSPEEFYSVKEKTTTVISAEDFTRIKNEVENYLKNGIDEFILMFRVIKKNGEICFFEDKANIIKDDNGNKSYIQGVLIDITEKVKIEKEMQKQQMQVFQNIKMASLGQVVAGVAHEINNPNCLIMLNVTLLEDYWKHLKPIFDEYQKLQQNIETKKTDKIINNIKSIISELNTGSNRIKTIVDNLKDFSREGVESCKEYYSIKEIIEKAYLICGGAVRKRVSHIEFDIPDNLPMLYCNSVKIEQVFINLMTNAADAIIDSIIGRIKISCNLSGSEHIEFHIIDNGKGISRKNIDKIFEPFYTTKFNSGGTGLGLSIAWGIIKEHNGEIFVNSKEGEGTEFIIKLPVKKV